MSPKTVIATVRGIGVAVMTSTWGGRIPFSRKASRCSTPKRCCSSTTTRARSANCTCFWMRACVPMTMPASPDAAASNDRLRALAAWLPVSSATVVPCSAPPSMPPRARSPSMAVIERWCCAASTSVGASSAACPPASMAASIARRATTVLPEPTSPCSSRCIGRSDASSAVSTSPISRCPAVSSKGSRASKSASSPPGRGGRGVASSDSAALRRWARMRLEDEGLVVLQPVEPPATAGRRRAGRCTSSSAAARSSQPTRCTHPLGHRLADAVDRVERRVHEPSELEGVDLARRRVDRDPMGPIPLHRGLALGVVVEELVLRVGQLHPLAVGADRADEEATHPGVQLALVSVGAEEGDVELVPVVVGEHDRQHLAAAVAHRPGRRAGHLGHDEHVLADPQRRQVGELPGAHVAPRHELEEVADGLQPLGAGELLGLALLDELGQR